MTPPAQIAAAPRIERDAAPPAGADAAPIADVDRALGRLRLRLQLQAQPLRASAAAASTDAGAAELADEAELAASLASLEAGPLAEGSRLVRLAQVFGLDARELDLIEGCLAFDVDPGLGRVFAWLADQPARIYPTEAVLARVYQHGLARVLTPESPLLRWGLVREEVVGPGEPAALSLDPLVRDWLVGQNRLDRALVGVVRLIPALPPLSSWPVEATARWVQKVLRASGSIGRVRIIVVGPPGSGRRTFAACVAEAIGIPLLAVDCDAVADEGWDAVVRAAHRQAFLDGCAIAWSGERACSRRWPDPPTAFPVQLVCGEAGAVPPASGLAERTVVIEPLEVAERSALWRASVAGADEWRDDELVQLASQHRLTPGEIAAAAARAPDSAVEAAAIAREASRHRLGDLARWVEGSFAWDDLVLPAGLREALTDLVFEARERAVFWEQAAARRLFPQGRGLLALFTGSPGTGKTMAAQVIASALGLDLFRISLAAVVSKYVGETAKNLHAVLARAEAMDAVLLFDEADALFAKRTDVKDAHDRFANTDTNFLLQAIESYRGIAILASNKKANIDAAFLRRLRWVLEFPKPGAGERRALWGRLVGELAGQDRAAAMAGSLDALATSVELTGAQIKLSVLAGMFAARQERGPLAVRHLIRGLERELGKEGRALADRDRQRLADA